MPPGRFAEPEAPKLGMELNPVDARNAEEIEHAVAAFARAPDGGLIVCLSPLAANHYHEIIALAARHRLPAVYPYRLFAGGGLICYGPVLASAFTARPVTLTASSRAKVRRIAVGARSSTS